MDEKKVFIIEEIEYVLESPGYEDALITEKTDCDAAAACWHSRPTTFRRHTSPFRRQFRILVKNVAVLVICAAFVYCFNFYPPITFEYKQFRSLRPGSQGCKGPRKSFEQHETTRSIFGHFELFDDLTLSTTTGSIDVTVSPRPGCGPQILELSAQTGSVRVRIVDLHNNTLSDEQGVTYKFLERPINTHVVTKTGSIIASLVLGHGSSMSLTAYTGSIEANIHVDAVSTTDPISHLYTSTATGHQNINLESSFAFDPHSPSHSNHPINHIAARHESKTTGHINLAYPHTWEGKVWARAVGTGQVSVQGSNLHFMKSSSREIVAYRGEEHDGDGHSPHEGRQNIDAVAYGTGSINFAC